MPLPRHLILVLLTVACTGQQGPPGPQGLAGSQGPQGAIGPGGTPGTPAPYTSLDRLYFHTLVAADAGPVVFDGDGGFGASYVGHAYYPTDAYTADPVEDLWLRVPCDEGDLLITGGCLLWPDVSGDSYEYIATVSRNPNLPTLIASAPAQSLELPPLLGMGPSGYRWTPYGAYGVITAYTSGGDFRRGAWMCGWHGPHSAIAATVEVARVVCVSVDGGTGPFRR